MLNNNYDFNDVKDFDEIQVLDDQERLILLRKRLGKKQWEFAEELGVSSSYLGQVENYKFKFTKNLKKRINQYLTREKKKDAKNLFSNFK